MEDPRGQDVFVDKAFDLLRDFLQPGTSLSLKTLSRQILRLLPERAPESYEAGMIGDLFIELAEQIPYHHPSQLKLVTLLESLGKSPKVGRIYPIEVNKP